jgi:hypothetical protein
LHERTLVAIFTLYSPTTDYIKLLLAFIVKRIIS